MANWTDGADLPWRFPLGWTICGFAPVALRLWLCACTSTECKYVCGLMALSWTSLVHVRSMLDGQAHSQCYFTVQ